jgi:hypothetical protein
MRARGIIDPVEQDKFAVTAEKLEKAIKKRRK